MVDANGSRVEYSFDAFARLTAVRGPNDLDPMVEPTIAAEYSLGNPAQNLRAYAWSKHKDTAHMNDPIETVAFVDGFGRSEAVKREVDIEVDGTSSPVHDVRR